METINIILLSLIVFAIPWFRRRYFFSQPATAAATPLLRLEYLDMMKGVAILAVIIIHVTYFFFLANTAGLTGYFNQTLNNLSRFCIPVFFIISGILMSPERFRADKRTFYLKKSIRNLIPYILVSMIMLFNLGKGLSSSIYSLVSGNTLEPYYFIILLFQFYLVYPWLIRSKDHPRFLIFCFILTFISQFILELSYIGDIPVFTRYLFFFAYGIKIRDEVLSGGNRKRSKGFWLWLMALYLVLTLVLPDRYYNIRPFYGLAIFWILFYYKERIMAIRPIKRFFVTLGRYSLWEFLLHYVVVAYFFDFYARFDLGYFSYFGLILVSTVLETLLFSVIIAKAYDIITNNYLNKVYDN